MSKCEICKKEIYEGHVMFDHEFNLCEKCFDKFYGDEKLIDFMYENQLQYFTQFEDYIDLNDLSVSVEKLRNRLSLEGSQKVYGEDFMLLDIVLDLIENVKKEESE